MKFTQSNKPFQYGILIAIFVLSLLQRGICQFDPPQNFKQKMAFTESKTSYYVLDDYNNLTPLEKLKLKKQEEVNRVEKYILDGDKPLTRITHRSANFYKDWMAIPHLIVISDSLTTMYNENGDLTISDPHTAKYFELRRNTNELKYVQFPEIPQKRIDDLITMGAIVSNISSTKKLISSGNNEFIYDPSALYLEKRTKDTSGVVLFAQKRKYKTLTDGTIVPLQFEERKYVRFNSGVCGEFVQRTNYSEYNIADNRSSFSSIKGEEKNNFIILPNPSSNKITIKIPYANNPNLVGNLNIFAFDGKFIQEKKVLQNTDQIFQISDWTPGIYFVKLTLGEKVYTTKFVKQ